MKRLGTAATALSLTLVVGAWMGGSRAEEAPLAEPLIADAALPAAATAERALNESPRHREWVVATAGEREVPAFVVYPERADKAPVVIVSSHDGVTDTWLRALADQFAEHGLLAVVPDGNTGAAVTSRAADEAVTRMARGFPAAADVVTHVVVDRGRGHAQIRREGDGAVEFALTQAEWPRLLSYIGARATAPAASDPHADHAMHMLGAAAAQAPTDAQGRGGGGARGGGGPRGGGGGLAGKDPAIVASIWTAPSTVARTTLRHEWVDIPMGATKLHTWIEYPEGTGPAPVVLVMQHGPGLDAWVRSVADQLASEGFIAVAPDLFSGFGPNGGNYDSFKTPDEAMRVAGPRATPEESMRRYTAAWNYAMKLPRANGKSGTIGFCAGGGYSFRFAADVPEINAAVVFYGTAPDEAALARIKAPVIGFYGEDDARVTMTVEPTAAAMKKLGKSFESHIYPGATHSFLLYQVEGRNQPATQDAWPRATAFLKEHLR